MAAMDTGVVRVYRDIEGDVRGIQDAFQKVDTIRLEITGLDDEISVARENLSLSPSDGSKAQQVRQRERKRDILYQQLEVTSQRFLELRQRPTRPFTLQVYLEACHSVFLAMPARDLLVPAHEARTHDEIRPMSYPRDIVPSTDFAAKQLGIWNELAQSDDLGTEAWYPSVSELEWMRQGVDGYLVGCQQSLFQFMQSTVDNVVDKILDHIVQDEYLLEGLKIGGEFRFPYETPGNAVSLHVPC